MSDDRQTPQPANELVRPTDGTLRGIVVDVFRNDPLVTANVIIACGAFYALSLAKTDMHALIIGGIALVAFAITYVATPRRIR